MFIALLSIKSPGSVPMAKSLAKIERERKREREREVKNYV